MEKFKLTKNSDGTYSFRGGKDWKYCADEDWRNRIICNRGGIGGWERFKINKNSDGTYSLKGGKGGKYCADEGNTIKCNRGGIGSGNGLKLVNIINQVYLYAREILVHNLTVGVKCIIWIDTT